MSLDVNQLSDHIPIDKDKTEHLEIYNLIMSEIEKRFTTSEIVVSTRISPINFENISSTDKIPSQIVFDVIGSMIRRDLLGKWVKELHKTNSTFPSYNLCEKLFECIPRKELIKDLYDNPYDKDTINQEEELYIVDEIFSYIIDNKNKLESMHENNSSFQELIPKLMLNFKDDELTSVQNMFLQLWGKKSLVEEYIGNASKHRVDELIEIVQSYFRKIKENERNPIGKARIIDDIADTCIPKDKKDFPHYRINAKAILLYLFERCYVGKANKM